MRSGGVEREMDCSRGSRDKRIVKLLGAPCASSITYSGDVQILICLVIFLMIFYLFYLISFPFA